MATATLEGSNNYTIKVWNFSNGMYLNSKFVYIYNSMPVQGVSFISSMLIIILSSGEFDIWKHESGNWIQAYRCHYKKLQIHNIVLSNGSLYVLHAASIMTQWSVDGALIAVHSINSTNQINKIISVNNTIFLQTASALCEWAEQKIVNIMAIEVQDIYPMKQLSLIIVVSKTNIDRDMITVFDVQTHQIIKQLQLSENRSLLAAFPIKDINQTYHICLVLSNSEIIVLQKTQFTYKVNQSTKHSNTTSLIIHPSIMTEASQIPIFTATIPEQSNLLLETPVYSMPDSNQLLLHYNEKLLRKIGEGEQTENSIQIKKEKNGITVKEKESASIESLLEMYGFESN